MSDYVLVVLTSMARAMGLNTISTHVFWNLQNPRRGTSISYGYILYRTNVKGPARRSSGTDGAGVRGGGSPAVAC